jgi:hypothetical protein
VGTFRKGEKQAGKVGRLRKEVMQAKKEDCFRKESLVSDTIEKQVAMKMGECLLPLRIGDLYGH